MVRVFDAYVYVVSTVVSTVMSTVMSCLMP